MNNKYCKYVFFCIAILVFFNYLIPKGARVFCKTLTEIDMKTEENANRLAKICLDDHYLDEGIQAISKIKPRTHENLVFLYEIKKQRNEKYDLYLNECLELEKFNDSQTCFEEEVFNYIDLKNFNEANNLYIKMINESNKVVFVKKYKKFLIKNKNEKFYNNGLKLLEEKSK